MVCVVMRYAAKKTAKYYLVIIDAANLACTASYSNNDAGCIGVSIYLRRQ
jgi:hypothetical protein